MPKRAYIDKKLQKKSLALISQVNGIISDYEEQGYSLTLRQVYYQLVSKNIIENSERSYNNLGNVVKDGRMTGLIDWEAIEDRTRFLRQLSHWESPEDIIKSAARSYRIDLWQDQEYYLEVWCEKDAVIGIVEQTANEYDVPCFSCRGYGSTTGYWDAAQRIIRRDINGKRCIILHFGDFDPSGTDMTRDIQDRLNKFGAVVEVKRIALNMPQIEEYDPPPQPVKTTDKRTPAYIEKYGVTTSWELDALEPSVLDGLITDNILQYLDMGAFEQAKIRQDQERQKILNLQIT